MLGSGNANRRTEAKAGSATAGPLDPRDAGGRAHRRKQPFATATEALPPKKGDLCALFSDPLNSLRSSSIRRRLSRRGFRPLHVTTVFNDLLGKGGSLIPGRP